MSALTVSGLGRAAPLSYWLTAAGERPVGERTFGESTKRLVITSYNIDADDVYLFRTPHLPTLARDWRERAVTVAMSTAAAPTYLPGMRLDGARLVDGGLWGTPVGGGDCLCMALISLVPYTESQ